MKMTKLIASMMLAGFGVFALSGCDGDSVNINDLGAVSIEELADTDAAGTGYKVNVDLEFVDGIFDGQHNDITYYFCSGAYEGLDYYAYTSESTYTPIEDEPDFDYGELSQEDIDEIYFGSDSAPWYYYLITDPEGNLLTGNTYVINGDSIGGEFDGSATINSIEAYTCPESVGPPPEL